MKIKHLLIGMLAMAAAVACKQDEPVAEPVLEVSKSSVAVAATAGEATFNVTANNSWSASADKDWVSLEPASGAGAEKAVAVKVTADDNTATEARTATVTVKSGELTKTVKVTQAAAEAGEEPGPGDDPTPGEVSWGMMGCFVDNLWSTDVPMTKEGEWIVAKGAQFTELTFKIRGNGSWDDATNIGRAPGSERAVVNGKIEVVTAEYAKANLGGDAADIKLNGEAGTYDVYFSFENLEVYVMEEGFKPGEKEPQNPDPVEITYTVVGTLADAAWVNNAPAGLMAKEGDLYVAKNVPFVWNSTCYGGNYNIIEFKIVETGTWDGFAYPESNVNQYANAEITVQVGGENIAVNAPEGSYDVYFDKANLKVWVMEAGFKPGEKEPLIPEEVEPVTEGDIWVNDGTVGAAAWSGSPYRFAKEGMDGLNECCAQIPAAVWEGMKIAPFCVNVKPATAETEWWQIRVLDGWWTKNDESGASDINPQSEGLVNNGDGTFTFQVDLASNPELVALIDAQHLLFAGDGFIINKMYFGDLPTPGEPEQPELQKSNWALVGSFNNWDAAGSTAFLSVLDTDYFVYYAFEAGANTEFKFVKDGKWASQGGAEVGGAIGTAEPNTIQAAGGKNIVIAEAGKYDIYLASDCSKFYVMTEGKLPAEATEPAPVEVTYTVVGTLNGINWNNNAPEGLLTKEGEYYVGKNIPFVTAKTLYGGADQFEFKVVETGTWNGYGAPAGMAAASANTEITLKESGDNIPVKAAEGNYDVYFDKANAKVWVMEPGLKPGETPAAPVDVDIDGKQWVFTWNTMSASCVVDLGVTEPGVAILAYDMAAIDPDYAGIYFPYMFGTYTITKTDGTSGVVTLTDPEYGDTIDIPYSNATETTVHFATMALLEEDIDCTLATSKIEISLEATEYLADGEYWIIANDKVATPLTSNYGYLQVTDAINGKSYASNAFTFTQVEEGLYTIQDASGKYYYQSGTYNSFNVSATDGGTDEYLWEVYDTGNGQYAIINYETGKYIQLDSEYGTYGSYAEEKGAMPILVLAEDPIAEPEPDPTPTVSTIESVLALGSNATIPSGTSVEGYVISNMDLNNLTSKKGMYIQDETAGLQFYLAENHTFKFGDKVKVDLSGAKVGAYNGAVQISGLALSKIEKLSSGNTVEPKTVTIADFLANKYEGQYVAIEDVQVVDADLSKTFVMGGAHTSIKIENADGKNFVVFSSKYATYGTTKVPQGSGTLKGISSINNGNMQIIFAQNSDYEGLTGTRFGEEVVEPEPEQPETPVAANRADFETFPEKYGQYNKEFTSTAGWHTVNCAIQEGGNSDANPVFICIGKVPGTEEWAKAVCINGKVGASGVLTSPVIAGGCGTLSFTMANVFSDKNGISFQIEVIQNGEVVKTLTVTKGASEVTQKVPIEHSVEVNVSGSFELKFTNLSPSNSTSSNKDRVSLWNMTWTSFE